MEQLDLFKKKPMLEVGKAYRFIYGYNDQCVRDLYITNFDYHGDPWESYCSISYFAVSPNTLENGDKSIHDCGGYIWEKGYRNKIEVNYQMEANSFYELTGDDLLKFLYKLKDKHIRKKYSLPEHEVWKNWFKVAG